MSVLVKEHCVVQTIVSYIIYLKETLKQEKWCKQACLTYDLVIEITPWKTLDVPPKTGSSAKSRPTAQSCGEEYATKDHQIVLNHQQFQRDFEPMILGI